MVRIAPITKENGYQCFNLKVTDAQKVYVGDNTYSIAQAYLHPDIARPYAIYAGEDLVGFAMLYIDLPKQVYYLWRFMVDHRFQQKGYGKAAMRLLIACFAEAGAKEITLNVAVGNVAATRLYQSVGFTPTGKIDPEDGVEMRLCL